MDMARAVIEFIFSFALFINAALFIPQAIKIFRDKNAKDVSLLTFLGFLLIQLATVVHGIINHDRILVIGYLLSMLTCGSVVLLIRLYRKRNTVVVGNDISLGDILEQLPGHIYWKDKDGVYLGCNRNNWKDFGLASYLEFKGKTDYDLFSKDEAKQIKSIDQEVIRTGQLEIAEELTTTDGQTSIYLSHKMPLKNHQGQIIGILGNSIDITNSKKAVMDRFEMLENIIAVMPGNVYWMNREGVYLGCNDNQAKAIGFLSRHDIVGKRNDEICGFFIPEFLDTVNRKVMETGKAVVVEEPALLSDGTQATFLSNKVPLRNQRGEITGMVGISIDITERKEAERNLKMAKEMAEAANEMKTEFLRNMRHDLRTPFSGLLGLADLIESQETDPKKKEDLACVTQSAKVLLDQLNEIFELVEIENGQLPIIDKIFDIHEIIHSVYEMLLPSAKSKQLDFTLTINKELPQYIIGDRVRTQRVLINVLSNAIKFTEKGIVKFVVDMIPEAKREIIISFVIEDTGIGIPENKQEMIFERFNRLTSSYSSAYSGKGLGLRIVKQFLDEIGGNIYLTSKMSKGSCFKILIPYKLPLESPENIEQELIQEKTKIAGKPKGALIKNISRTTTVPISDYLYASDTLQAGKLLLVEDHRVAARIAKTILIQLGCEVDIAETGKAALELAEKNAYDLIFMDIGLPDIDGWRVAEQIRSSQNLTQVPIIALTAHAENEEKQRCLAIGMNMVITKPLTKKWAESVLENFIPKRERQKRQVKEVANIKPVEKIVDIEYAKALVGGNEAVVQEMLTMLVDSLPEEIKALKAAYQEKDWQQLKSIAHKLKGGASYCGTLRLKSACTELENYIKSDPTATKIPELYQKVLAEIKAIQNFMNDQSSA